jgi:complex iron-sulfur molybdoenzyme family reductase subunit gamma
LAEDSWGNILVPRNLSNPESFRNGYGQADIMKTLSRGLTGSPMASYRDVISVSDRWHLVNYVRSLSETPKQFKDERVLAVKAEKLPTTADDDAWDGAPVARLSLVSQVIEPPRLYWPSVEFVNAQALYNTQGLAMKVTWDDRSNSTGSNTEDTYEDRDGTVYRDTDHPDQLALQFPAKKDKDGARPYFLLGDKKRAVNTWWWRADTNALTEINAKGFGSFQPQSAASQQVKSTVTYADGRYTMIINRPLTTSDRNDVQFEEGGWTPVGFNVWDGTKGEIGQRRSVSTWYWLFLEPEIPAQAHVLPPVMFLLTLGVLGMLVRTTREWAKVESGEQESPTPMMSEQAPTTDGKYGILIGIFGVLIGAVLMQGVASNGTDPVQMAIGNHQNISLATGSFYESSDIDDVRNALIGSGVPNTLASANDLNDAHLTLEGGVRIDGDQIGGAFRYRHGEEVFVLQKYNKLPGGGTTEHSRHIGHMLMRGYEGIGSNAAVWEMSGTFYVFTGQGSQEHILTVAAKAFFDVDSGGNHH